MPDTSMLPEKSTKSHFLNAILNLKNQNGDQFQHNIRQGLVITDDGHSIWFTVPQGGLNHFFKKDGTWFVEETLNKNRKSWGDRDRAEEIFKAGKPAIRSVILRGDNSNRYYGEFMLFNLEARTRVWVRIATSVDFEGTDAAK